MTTRNKKMNESHSDDKEKKKMASAEARFGLHKAKVQDGYYSGRGCAILLDIEDEVLAMLLHDHCSSRTWSPTPSREQPRTGLTDSGGVSEVEDTYPEFDSFFNECSNHDTMKETTDAQKVEGRDSPADNPPSKRKRTGQEDTTNQRESMSAIVQNGM